MKFYPVENFLGVMLIEPDIYKDDRGFFEDIYRIDSYKEVGIKLPFVQEYCTGSVRNTIRGMHYQVKPHQQGKLVKVTSGVIKDVFVDMRKSSLTYGKWGKVDLFDRSGQLWIPPGFAHGFEVLSDWANVTYKVTSLYSPAHERVLLWNDPIVGINWRLENETPIMSDRDWKGKWFSPASVSAFAFSEYKTYAY